MRERVAQILKIVCCGLAALLIVQLVKVAHHANPLAGATLPQVPSLPVDTNAAPAVAGNKPPRPPGTNSPMAATGTNGPKMVADTNGLVTVLGTNAATHKKSKRGETNAEGSTVTGASTNAIHVAGTNIVITTSVDETNSQTSAAKEKETNATPVVVTTTLATNTLETNLAIAAPSTNAAAGTNAIAAGTNSVAAKLSGGTNLVVNASAKTNLTNSAIAKASGSRPPPGMMPPMMGGPGGRGSAAKLSPEIQARVDRVTDSEILAPVMHPMPMALLGIAGKVAFLRAPSGQTGMVKEGEDLGEIKLLRIGTNRVLVEQDGKKQELMIFSGLGGDSLLPKTTETSDETTKN
jgi:hypothetical protein